MSLTLKIATATTIVLSKAKSLMNGLIFQKVGTSFSDVTQVTMTQNIGNTGTAKSRFVIKLPYTAVVNGVNVSDFAYLTVEATVPQSCPLATAGQLTWLGQSLCADTSFNDLVANRVFSAV